MKNEAESTTLEAIFYKKFHDHRNELNPVQLELVENEAKMIANELRVWLDKAEIAYIKATPNHELAFKCSALSLAIRNEYELWIDGHHITDIWRRAEKKVPLAMTGTEVDDHLCHPDNFSFYCLVKLKELLR